MQIKLQGKAKAIRRLKEESLAAYADTVRSVLYSEIERRGWTQEEKLEAKARVDSFAVYLRSQPVVASDMVFSSAELRQMFSASAKEPKVRESLLYLATAWFMPQNGPVMIDVPNAPVEPSTCCTSGRT